MDDDRDLLWLALLSEARHTGVPVLNCSDGDGYSEREHSSNEVTQHVYVRDEGWVVAVPGYQCTGAQSSIMSPSALQPLWLLPLPLCMSQILAIRPWRVLHLHLICPPLRTRRPDKSVRCPIHFDLTADDSEEECLPVAMQMASRSGATYSVTLCRSECRWPTRRRVTCLSGLAEEQHFPTVDPVLPEQPDLLAMGGRVGFLILWANDIEESGGSPEERRAEYRQLLGEMCLFEGDPDGAEREFFYHLVVTADLEHDATIDPEGEMRDICEGTRLISMHLLEVQMARPRIRRRRRSKR